jgi:two-component system, LytTR family, sensor histidine kinase AlgZ
MRLTFAGSGGLLSLWALVAGLLAYLLAGPGGLTWTEALAVSIPLCLVYAFVCLSAYYSCRATPVEQSGWVRLTLTHLTAAFVASGVWILSAKILGGILSSFAPFRGLDTRLPKSYPLIFGIGILLYLLRVASYYVRLSIEASQEAKEREMKASVLARDAELRALKAQVNPHFLFNSLNSISALTSSDAPKAREMCVLLADFLRRTLGLGERASISLEEELSLIRSFLAVEKIRFGARLQMEESIDKNALDVSVPPLLLQPLVENAVAHGIANLVEGGSIRLEAHCQDGALSLAVENRFDPEAPPKRKSGVGLANVRQRLEARYGHLASFQVKKAGDVFRVALVLPAERETQSS